MIGGFVGAHIGPLYQGVPGPGDLPPLIRRARAVLTDIRTTAASLDQIRLGRAVLYKARSADPSLDD